MSLWIGFSFSTKRWIPRLKWELFSLVFGRCPNRISAMSLTVLTKVSRDFLRSVHTYRDNTPSFHIIPGLSFIIIQGYMRYLTASLNKSQILKRSVWKEVHWSRKSSTLTMFLIFDNDECRSVCGFGLLFHICQFLCSDVGLETAVLTEVFRALSPLRLMPM